MPALLRREVRPPFSLARECSGTNPEDLPTDAINASSKEQPPKPKPLFRNVTLREYYSDLDFLLNVCSDGPAKSFAFRRLKYLASKWNLYCLLNEYQEIADMKVSIKYPRRRIRRYLIRCNSTPRLSLIGLLLHQLHLDANFDLTFYSISDFYNVRKVDTHVHHSASMNQKHLLRFIKSEWSIAFRVIEV
jgi:AMP deaminase